MREGSSGRDKRLTRAEVEQLLEAEIIPAEQREPTLARFRKEIDWLGWVERWTTTLGAIFLLAGILFFFAWNWKDLSPLVRFGVLEGGIVLAIGGAVVAGLAKPAGQWLLLAASVLTGVLLAVFGQVYQTGADAFEVFAYWALLTLVWTALSRFPALWILWFAVLQTAIATYAGQVLIPEKSMHWSSVYLTLGVLSLGFVALREWAEGFDRFSWVREEGLRLVLVASAIFWLSATPWEAIFDIHRWRSETPPLGRGIGIVVWMAVVVGGIWFYTFRRPSLTSVGLCALSGAIIATAWIGRLIIEEADDAAIAWLAAAVAALLIFSGAALLISRASRLMPDASEENPPKEVVE